MASENTTREHWSGSLGFVLAAAGSAIGLGNIWKFPYIAGENGGAAFIIVYLICIAVVGMPVLLCELAVGRGTQRDPVGAFKALSPGRSHAAHLLGAFFVLLALFMLPFKMFGWAAVCLLVGTVIFFVGWQIVGYMGVLAGFVILSFYSVVAGWVIGYAIKAITGQLPYTDVAQTEAVFNSFISSPGLVVGCHFLFMLLCVLVVIGGIRNGIERWSKILMPALLFLLFVLVVRGISLDNSIEGVQFLITPDFSKLTPTAVLEALGHACFTLSIGMGALITYGSYLDRKQNLLLSTLAIAGLDTFIAILAGFAIFPALFAMQGDPTGGPGLIFVTVPAIFNQLPSGGLWNSIFFILISMAALTSGISLLEVVTTYLVDERKWPRKAAVVVMGAFIFVLGSFVAVSVGSWENLQLCQKALQTIFGEGHVAGSLFNVMDHLASNWLLPLGGMFICVFVGWIWGTKGAVDEIRNGSKNFADVHLFTLLAGLHDDESHNSPVHVVTLGSVWGVFIRFISPVLVLVAFLNTLGWLNFEEVAEMPEKKEVAAEQVEADGGKQKSHASTPSSSETDSTVSADANEGNDQMTASGESETTQDEETERSATH